MRTVTAGVNRRAGARAYKRPPRGGHPPLTACKSVYAHVYTRERLAPWSTEVGSTPALIYHFRTSPHYVSELLSSLLAVGQV